MTFMFDSTDSFLQMCNSARESIRKRGKEELAEFQGIFRQFVFHFGHRSHKPTLFMFL